MTIDSEVKDLVGAAYLHGLCVENLDTGGLEPPRDISEVQWIVDKLEHKIAQEANKAQQELLSELLKDMEDEYDERGAAIVKLHLSKIGELNG